MHYFALSSGEQAHMGFLVLMTDDGREQADSGCLALKAQADAETQVQHATAWRVLDTLASEAVLYWRRQGEGLDISDADGRPLGRLQQQFLTLQGQSFVLQDLSGAL